jgi:ABC-type multidrug transport system fused ATPase/permease subunit
VFRIVVDGADIAQVDPENLRARIALVPQDPVVFSGTVSLGIVEAQEQLEHRRLAGPGRPHDGDALAGRGREADGADIAQVDPENLRARIALVPQDPVVFSGTVSENRPAWGS